MRRLKSLLALGAALLVSETAAASSFVLSQVQIDNGSQIERRTSESAGALVQAELGTGAGRVVTDLGLNKVSLGATGAGVTSSHATSIWAETFTVGGSGPVTITTSFRIDGQAFGLNAGLGGDAEDVNFNYYLKAVKGGIGALIANNSDASNFEDVYFFGEGREIYVDGDDRTFGVTASTIRRADHYEVTPYNTLIPLRFYEDHVVLQNGTEVFYASSPQYAGLYANVVASYPILASASLCPLSDFAEDGGTCGAGSYDEILTLSFTLFAGQQYSLVGGFMVEDLALGSVDFFSTARLTGIAVSPGATLTSDSGRLQFANGQYAFSPLAGGAVPEPATWAMMIAGFGMVGGTMRRQRGNLRAA